MRLKEVDGLWDVVGSGKGLGWGGGVRAVGLGRRELKRN